MSEDVANEAVLLAQTLRERLGDDWFAGAGEIAIEATSSGRAVIHAAGLAYFLGDGDELVAARQTADRVDYGVVSVDGETVWGFSSPKGDPGMN